MKRKLWAALLLMIASLVTVGLSGCGGGDDPVADDQPVEPVKPDPPKVDLPKPKPKPITIAAFQPVTVDPGSTTPIEVTIQRNGNKGPVQLGVAGDIEGISAKTVELPADQSTGKLALVVGTQFGQEQVVKPVKVTAKFGKSEAEQTLQLTINQLLLPSFKPTVEVIMQPGRKATIDLEIDRNGYEGVLALKAEGFPTGVTAEVGTIAAGANQATLQLTTATNAADVVQDAKVIATVKGRSIVAPIRVQVSKQPFTINSLSVVTLKAGETKQVKLPITRKGYNGVISVKVDKLPEGVSIQGLEVADGATTADLAFTAAVDAKPRVVSAEVVGSGGQLTLTSPIVVRVTRSDGGYLPIEAVTDPDLARHLRRGAFGGRLTNSGKQVLMDAFGGTLESERAVRLGLRWLAAHQNSNGSWPLKGYSDGIPDCDCEAETQSEVGDHDAAGTAFGILPFLGAGIAHNRSPDDSPIILRYRDTVQNGVAYLTNIQVKDRDPKKAGRLSENMYAHAIATMALCEAFAISQDDRLRTPAQMAIRYLVEAQYPSGGGWRYSPRTPGDLSVTAWVFLAIRNGQLAGLTIRETPLLRAERFLNACGAGPDEAEFSQYGYQARSEPKLTMTAAGLLTRQYLGWSADNPHLVAGCEHLMKTLPPATGTRLGLAYYYYYATQVLHHKGDADFDLWNHLMREHLIRTQEQAGHQVGSWSPVGTDHGATGGRLYATAMAMMTLQIYYRHLPIHHKLIQTSD